MRKRFPEADLCRIATNYLQAQHWKVAAEVAQLGRTIDLIAERDGKVLCLEAKTSLTRKLRYQIGFLQGHHFAVALVGSRPRKPGADWLRKRGIGIWTVTDGQIEVIAEPLEETQIMAYYRDRLKSALVRYANQPTEAGMPCLKGIGPAVDVQERVDAYQTRHPRATWKEIFLAVPNHYKSSTSMASALRANRERKAHFARQGT